MKVVAVIPVKLNNVRVPGKNIKPFSDGTPLIKLIQASLLKSKRVDEIYVYCSNEKIKDYLLDGVKYLKRDASLDTDQSTMNDVLSAFVKDVDADVYLLTHATAPFLKHESIDKGIDAIINDGYDSALSVKDLYEFYWIDNKPHNYDITNIPRTQDLDPIHIETTGFYCFKKELISIHNRRIGDNPYLVKVNEIEAIDINNPFDFEVADLIYTYKKNLIEGDERE